MSDEPVRKRVRFYAADAVDLVRRDRHVRTYYDRMERPARLIQRVWRAERTTRYPRYNTFRDYRDRKLFKASDMYEALVTNNPLVVPAEFVADVTDARLALDPSIPAAETLFQIETILDQHLTESEHAFKLNRSYHRKLVNPIWLEAKAEADLVLANYV